LPQRNKTPVASSILEGRSSSAAFSTSLVGEHCEQSAPLEPVSLRSSNVNQQTQQQQLFSTNLYMDPLPATFSLLFQPFQHVWSQLKYKISNSWGWRYSSVIEHMLSTS
jgi:hypothetical protein